VYCLSDLTVGNSHETAIVSYTCIHTDKQFHLQLTTKDDRNWQKVAYSGTAPAAKILVDCPATKVGDFALSIHAFFKTSNSYPIIHFKF